MAQAVLQAAGGHYSVGEHELAVTPSIGIALCPADGEDAETLLKSADTAMYHAKSAGRNNYQFFTAAMNTRVREHLELENRLRQALARERVRASRRRVLMADWLDGLRRRATIVRPSK